MDTAVYKGEEIYCFRGFHRKLRVYWRLLNYTMNELNKEYERVDEIKDGLFKEVVKNSGKINKKIYEREFIYLQEQLFIYLYFNIKLIRQQ